MYYIRFRINLPLSRSISSGVGFAREPGRLKQINPKTLESPGIPRPKLLWILLLKPVESLTRFGD